MKKENSACGNPFNVFDVIIYIVTEKPAGAAHPLIL